MEYIDNVTYCGVCADIVHIGHINIINQAKQLDLPVMIGLLTDQAVCSYKKFILMTFDQRKTILEHIKGVDIIVPQYTLDYTNNMIKYKPQYVVHGDDWLIGI